jgi:hypothetical protein
MSSEPPPWPYGWTCLICELANEAASLQCARCGCPDRVDGRELAERQRQFKLGRPYDGTHKGKPKSRIPGRRLDGSNIVPFHELLRAAFCAVGLLFGLYQIAVPGKARVFLSRRDPGVAVHDTWALVFVVIGYTGMLVFSVAMLADHFDRRKNEAIYERVMKLAVGVGFPCLLLGIAVQAARS